MHIVGRPTKGGKGGAGDGGYLRQGLKESADTEDDSFWEGGVSVGRLASEASRYLVLSSSTSAATHASRSRSASAYFARGGME